MPTLTIEERIQVSAPPARVWGFLLDPARVAPCLPGAKLDGQEGENTFLGTMKVKVGPVTMDFKGKATMTEIHEAERRVVMIGTGNDKGGSGSAKMSMESRIIATEDGGSEIVVTADVDLAGKLMSFGRGMMGGISKQLFKQFAERVRVELGKEEPEEVPEAPPSDLPVAPEPAAAAPAEPAAKAVEPESLEKKPSEEPEPTPDAAPIVVTEASEPAVASSPAAEERAVESAPKAPPVEAPKAAPAEKAAPSAPKPAAKKKPSTAIVPEDNAPLSAGGLVFAALWDWIKGLFRRLFGGRKAP